MKWKMSLNVDYIVHLNENIYFFCFEFESFKFNSSFFSYIICPCLLGLSIWINATGQSQSPQCDDWSCPVISVKFNKIVLTAEVLSVGLAGTARGEMDEKCPKAFICKLSVHLSEPGRCECEEGFLGKMTVCCCQREDKYSRLDILEISIFLAAYSPPS